MRKDQEKAFELRRQKKSYRAISAELGIPKSTLASWFKGELWSREIRDALAQETSFTNPDKMRKVADGTRKKWAQWHGYCQQEAVEEFPSLKDDPLFIAGLMLYWGEGDRVLKNGIVRLGNSDPSLVKLFYLFLVKSLGVPKEEVRSWLLLYPDLVDSVQKNFWNRATGIPLDQFRKSTTIQGKHPTKRMSYGVCYVYIHSRKLKEKILKWIDLLQNDLQYHALKV